jgi:hypothetical protein
MLVHRTRLGTRTEHSPSLLFLSYPLTDASHILYVFAPRTLAGISFHRVGIIESDLMVPELLRP